MVCIFSGNRQSQMPLAPKARGLAFLATRKSPPIGNLQISVLRFARLGCSRSAAVARSPAESSSVSPVAGAFSLARRFSRRLDSQFLSRGLPRFSSCALPTESSAFSVCASVTLIGQSKRSGWPNTSINPTAGYGLSRFRISASAAAGYLQR